jgi:hypothetical protein
MNRPRSSETFSVFRLSAGDVAGVGVSRAVSLKAAY